MNNKFQQKERIVIKKLQLAPVYFTRDSLKPRNSTLKLSSSVNLNDSELGCRINTLKIPAFPLCQFGQHIEMLNMVPEFCELPEEIENDKERIKKIKKDAGRVQKSYSMFLPILKSKSKIKMKEEKPKNIIDPKIYFKRFWYGPGKRIKKSF